MRVAAALALLPAATAFVAPALPSSRVRSSLRMSVDDLGAGVTAPTGFFDPFGLSQQSNADIKKWRESELKHGRVAMLATVGYLVQESGYHPLFGLGDKELGLAAYHFQEVNNVAPLFWTALLFVIGLAETQNIVRGWQNPADVAENDIATIRDDYVTGDLGLDPFSTLKDADKFAEYRTKELNNGRLAMISILGMWGQELATSQSVISTLPFGK